MHGDYYLEGTVNGAGAAVEWAAQHFDLVDWQSRLPRWLETVTAPPVFLNSIGGLGSPWWRPGPAAGFLDCSDISAVPPADALALQVLEPDQLTVLLVTGVGDHVEELDEAIESMAGEVNQDAASLKESLVTSGRVGLLTGDILRRRALDRIVSSAVAVDDEGQDIDLSPPEVADDIEESADSSADEVDSPDGGPVDSLDSESGAEED